MASFVIGDFRFSYHDPVVIYPQYEIICYEFESNSNESSQMCNEEAENMIYGV